MEELRLSEIKVYAGTRLTRRIIETSLNGSKVDVTLCYSGETEGIKSINVAKLPQKSKVEK